MGRRGTGTVVLTLAALLAFAANSLLCRWALRSGAVIDPASFTAIRLASGALVLTLIAGSKGEIVVRAGSWRSAAALFVYAIAFSFAYVSLNTATGALILFGAVQLTMFGVGLRSGERVGLWRTAGIALAVSGLVILLLPDATMPSPLGAALMASAGISWGAYSLRGRGVTNPTTVTAGNFQRALLPALVTSAIFMMTMRVTTRGALLAAISGAVTSGLGYVVWYRALRGHSATSAAVVQLAVPVLAAIAGALLLGETLTLRFIVAALLTLGGIAIASARRDKA
ncbi:MAG: DMT family transporter [Myxococcota bacterium]|nr:DMT family transporter [Myxococcota bacterium]